MRKRVGTQAGRSSSRRGAGGFGRAGVSWLLDGLRHGIVSLSIRLLPKRRINGIEVVQFSGGGRPEPNFTRVEDALGILATHAPRRLARIAHDLRRIAFVAHGGEVYDHALRTYMVDVEVLQRRSAEEFALAIVHEATHARLRRSGIATTQSNVERVERLCVAQELEVASRLPGQQLLIRHTMDKLDRPWWLGDERNTRIDDQLRSLHVPEWILRLRRFGITRSR